MGRRPDLICRSFVGAIVRSWPGHTDEALNFWPVSPHQLTPKARSAARRPGLIAKRTHLIMVALHALQLSFH